MAINPEVWACMRCGSVNISRSNKTGLRLFDFAGDDLLKTHWTCQDCGFTGMPLIFDSGKEHKAYLKEIGKDTLRGKKLKQKPISGFLNLEK